MKNLLLSTALLLTVSVSAAMAGSAEPVFYDESVKQFYFKDGNKKVYLDITGATGPQGPIGPAGPQGLPGRDGVDGKDGVNGVDGRDGKDGVDGRDGVDGKDGVDGRDGVDGKDGVDGRDGKDGLNGVDGKDVDYGQYHSDMAAVAGLGGLEMRQGGAGVWSWSAGIGGITSGSSSSEAIAVGIHYGIQDNLGLYLKISKSLDGDSLAAFAGVEGQF